MQASVLVIIALLLVVAAGQRVNYVLSRKIAEHEGVAPSGIYSTLMDGCPMASPSSPPASAVAVPVSSEQKETTSGFSDAPDFMAHARKMDVVHGRGSAVSPAKKMESMMMDNDRAQRKLRATLVRGG
jgi:hypothetical protein